MRAFEKLVAFVFVTILVNCVAEVAGECNWNATGPCFAELNRGRTGERGKVKLSLFIDAFEQGIDRTCNLLLGVFSCVKNVTKDCRDGQDSENMNKIMIEKMKDNVEYLCAQKKRQTLVTAQSCMITNKMKEGMASCQSQLDATNPATCSVLTNVISCTDDILNKECTVIHHVLGHVLRSYMRDVLKLQHCTLSEHDNIQGHNHAHDDDDDDHHHGHDEHGHGKSGAASIQWSMLSALFVAASLPASFLL